MWRIVRAIVLDLDTRGVELLSAQLSLWFCVVFLTSDSTARPQPVLLWSAWCALAALGKVAGVAATLMVPSPSWGRWVRLGGNFLGLGFWTVLAGVIFILARGGIGWGSFGMIALAQVWCFYRVVRGR